MTEKKKEVSLNTKWHENMYPSPPPKKTKKTDYTCIWWELKMATSPTGPTIVQLTRRVGFSWLGLLSCHARDSKRERHKLHVPDVRFHWRKKKGKEQLKMTSTLVCLNWCFVGGLGWWFFKCQRIPRSDNFFLNLGIQTACRPSTYPFIPTGWS